MLIDTHAHVNFLQYKNDGDEVVKRSLAEGTWMINVGSEKDTSRRAVEYANRYEAGVFAAIGLHPIQLRAQEIEEKENGEVIKFTIPAEEFDEAYYADLAGQDKVVAIGEIGLDYYHSGATKELQREVFLKQIGLALKFKKPILVHCREANEDLQKIFKDWADAGKSLPSGVLHSFSGTMEQAQVYLDRGFHLGFNGIITFAHDYDEVIKTMPFDRVLVETDCPYLTPVPFRGKRNEPSYVKHVAQKIAELRGVSFEEVAEMTTANAKKLFNL